MDNKKLLAALEITSEEEQKYWLLENDIIDLATFISFPDLAFRLRDEVVKTHPEKYCDAIYLVDEYLGGSRQKNADLENDILRYNPDRYIFYHGKAIDMIIAALIAKNHNQRKD